jgi:hypothetical protein
MFELALVHLTRSDREREIEAALRRRQLLESPIGATASSGPSTVATPAPRAVAGRLRTAGR